MTRHNQRMQPTEQTGEGESEKDKEQSRASADATAVDGPLVPESFPHGDLALAGQGGLLPEGDAIAARQQHGPCRGPLRSAHAP